jgi:acetyl-CoA synthetase
MSDTKKSGIDSYAGESRKFPPSPELAKNAHIKSMEQYQEMYDESINEPDKFWLKQAETLDWVKKPTKAREYTWDTANQVIDVQWFEDGQLNDMAQKQSRYHLARRTRR